jgi:Thaumarchaeal output domain 1
MLNRAYTQAASAVERVLVVAQQAAASIPLCLEMTKRGARVSALFDIAQATQAVRAQQFDVVLVMAREDANATALFLQILKAEALGSPRILLLVDPDQATSYGMAIFAADEMLAATLEPERIADATGIGVDMPAPRADNLPAVFAPPTARFLALPHGLSRDLIPQGMAHVERGEIPDAVILTEPMADQAISAWMSAATAAVIPVIDATGLFVDRADAVLTSLSGLGVADALARVKPLTLRMQQLPAAYHRSHDPRQMLLARLAVRDRAVTAQRNPGLKHIVGYADEAAVGGVAHHAEALSRIGYLKARFFEKVQCCPSCTSARLIVREECSKCRSADVTEEPIIHHLRCGYQGPERDFRSGNDLICPKCRHHCDHFSVDYDKPGSLVLCNSCGHTTGEAEVGFKCLDCEAGFEGEKASTRVFHEYELTDEGRRAAFQPPLSGYGGDKSPDAQSTHIRERLKRFTAAHALEGKPCAVMLIKVDQDRVAQNAIGETRFQQSLALYASLLREIFDRDVEVIEAQTSFLVLIKDERADNVESALPDIRRELEQNLAIDLKARYHIFSASEIDTLM